MVLLLDFYQPVLTARQREILALYYEDDLTLSEIAEQMGISRQAVHDLVSRAGHILLQWEEKLGLAARFRANREKLFSLRRLIETDAGGQRQALLAQVDELIRSL
jgi:predicted DNA-binding protein YlxM (UPF0122 family)